MRWLAAMLAMLGAFVPAIARAEPPAVFAVIVGVNAGVDSELPALRYADDDAVLYQELFRQLGATPVLLARIDANTQRLHARAAAEARPPRGSELDRTIAATAVAAAAARARGATTTFYFVYAGHGNLRDGQGYINLEDERLTAADLKRRVVDAVPADQVHLIIDACYSGLLAEGRGPGGERRPLRGFSQLPGLASDDHIGLLLSTSSARESHEWEGFQAGVFSHEVRSGMYGAADANADGVVSYRELAAFVARANAAIPNERFRPDAYARPPRGSDVLVDLRHALHRRLEIAGTASGHYVIEDEHGVRVMDFHNATDQRVAVVRPASPGDVFLRRLDDNREYRVAATDDEAVTLDGLVAEEPRVTGRGAAHASFSLTFSLGFDEEIVRTFEPSRQADAQEPARARTWRRPATWVAFGVGGGALVTGLGLAVSAWRLRADASPEDSQASTADRNAQITRRNTGTAVCAGVAAAAVGTGLALLLWPGAHPGSGVTATVQPAAGGGAVVAIGGAF